MKHLIHIIGTRLIWIATVMALGVPGWAGEYVLLENGFRLYAERHESEGGVVRVFSQGGYTEVPSTAIVGYEPAEPRTPVAIAEEKAAPAALASPAADTELFKKSLTPGELASLAAKKFELPEAFVRSVMKAESGFAPNAMSPKGAIGLMQLMPETARNLGVNPKDPHQNADGGAQYLRDLLAKYEGNPDQVLLALAAYNAGPAAVDRYHGVPPYRETREYILRVLKNWQRDGIK